MVKNGNVKMTVFRFLNSVGMLSSKFNVFNLNKSMISIGLDNLNKPIIYIGLDNLNKSMISTYRSE